MRSPTTHTTVGYRSERILSASETGVVVDQANEALGYTRTEAISRTVYLHLTGATRAAADLGDKTAQGIKKRMAKKKQEEAEEAGANGEPAESD